jgi:mannose-6-phosphate isomerase-like protein (cupin superfamily)
MQTLLQGASEPLIRTYAVIAVTTLVSLCSTISIAQNATKTAPNAYKLQFENKWVRVIRVHYEPREKIPAHAHTQWPAAYVYLNNGGPVIFRHKDWEHPVLTRPATKAGSFRLSPTTAVNEVHEVENPNDVPSDFLRVEFKTQPIGRDSLRGRFYREDYPAGENYRNVQFENQQIRVTRLSCAPHKNLGVAASSTEPALFIFLSAARFISQDASAGKPTTREPGESIWVGVGQQTRFENLGDTPIELLQFDFKTAPVKPK